MNVFHMCSFSSLDEIPKRRRGNHDEVLRVLHKVGRFSEFEVDASLGRALDSLKREKLIETDTSIGYPWTSVKLTDAGLKRVGAKPRHHEPPRLRLPVHLRPARHDANQVDPSRDVRRVPTGRDRVDRAAERRGGLLAVRRRRTAEHDRRRVGLQGVAMNKLDIEIKVGQFWRDMDSRAGTRIRRVDAIEGEKAIMAHPRIESLSTRVRLDTLRRRWKLVEA